ncbi:MAG: hypothetical protein M1830_000577 [Pleopsidium flavum]|nr:MAG: hypothetical protein M1830_000577 [Pleopsidium flavum]
MSKRGFMDVVLESSSKKVSPENTDEESYKLLKDKFMQDACRDAAIDVFIDKCRRGVDGNFCQYITGHKDYHEYCHPPLSDDDAAFIMEMKEGLITDLCRMDSLGLSRHSGAIQDADDKLVYQMLQPRVSERYEIWRNCESKSQDIEPDDASFLKAAAQASPCPGLPTYEEWRSLKGRGAASSQPITDRHSLQLLSSAIQGEQATATFACGGTVTLRSTHDHDPAEEQKQLSCPPVILRWDSSEKNVARRLELPLSPGHGSELNRLLEDCQPATFGLGGVDVLDESYRKASKLDNTRFSTNFNPYDYGIVDTISQILFPSIDKYSDEDSGLELRGVRAELYKLNIYSGPSGMFHPHVDTPRGTGQFGSLVVCLPCAHSGGELVVRHVGSTIKFDWSTRNTNSNCIQWAAFYSDCEHEVLEVKSGHRLTLTYNLYLRENLHGTLGRTLTMSPEQLPLYGMAKDLLKQPGFMKAGGVLGFFCSHEYAHTHGAPPVRLPRSLKGVDMALYVVFRALGLKIEVLPILEKAAKHYGAKGYFGGIDAQDAGWKSSMSADKVYDLNLDYKTYENEDEDEESDGYEISDPEATNLGDYEDVETRLQSILRKRKIKGFVTKVDPVTVGTELHELVTSDWGEQEEPPFAVGSSHS